ncbi:hypothetical protein [Paenibacillus sp. MMS20-IR301]|uniref:hypothetical protein n=1 Tax=Paenibacillus sp. MMS20-IR301 TaxID=2895946 RepID=UPI0028EF1414|nr:hypothetical protein [Paenibacillus sp. MMS20-IR301]WNS45274.1 hypothetical protein LOS79_08390 [Paenibacillus sp. MMS20-IR301]
MSEIKLNLEDKVYVVIDLYFHNDKQIEKIAGATAHEATARMIAASGEEGHARFIEVYENGVKTEEFGYRDDDQK